MSSVLRLLILLCFLGHAIYHSEWRRKQGGIPTGIPPFSVWCLWLHEPTQLHRCFELDFSPYISLILSFVIFYGDYVLSGVITQRGEYRRSANP